MFKAILIDKGETGHVATLTELDDARLPEGDVIVRIEYSTVNYKDGLLITGRIPLIRKFPMVPGIDFAGTVEQSDHPDWAPGDRVVLNGWGVGEGHWGGLAQRARVRGEWLVRLPEAFTPRQAMAIGTAGYAAMLCVMTLERHGIGPEDGDILVTGASGGVGSVAIALLSRLGYRVVAATGRPAEADYLKALGAAEIIDRAALANPGEPMQAERWAGAIDTAGSHTLVNVCAAVRYGGAVAATGLAQGLDFPATVLPFVLRNLALYGVDSVMAPQKLRQRAWERLAQDLDAAKLESMIREVGLSEVIGLAPEILAGRVRGRLVVDMRK
ncbi:MAG TPA: MDR family oxidoreductase [Aromatoleum sp.]|uniref:acrylyl-CoA reductase (NADPH) n=1 Tax=Aromatoleum sp. TaxID=2307007 RepID=UPI002B48A496|nr:MDR family oxidoreductase [Aromatoleum sp.]HJV27692.1 MDR family oxidoreductase [Aromatoleum sp.]